MSASSTETAARSSSKRPGTRSGTSARPSGQPNRKEAEAADLGATIDDGRPFRVATVWVVSALAANRALIGRYPAIFSGSFPGSSRSWVSTLTVGAAPPIERGLVWYDPARGRLHDWRVGRADGVSST